jgi:predicted transcriptional regulator
MTSVKEMSLTEMLAFVANLSDKDMDILIKMMVVESTIRKEAKP